MDPPMIAWIYQPARPPAIWIVFQPWQGVVWVKRWERRCLNYHWEAAERMPSPVRWEDVPLIVQDLKALDSPLPTWDFGATA